MKKSLKSAFIGICLAAGIGIAPASADQIISLQSGNGPIASLDSQITFLRGPADSPFASAFLPADFTAARAGTSAHIITPHGSWQPKTLGTAQWISDRSTGASEGSSVLYAIDFTITDAFVSAAAISFDFSVDNLIGGGPNPALFVNGTALTGTQTGDGFSGINNFSASGFNVLLTTGVNTLYINTTDVGGPAGLLFSATIVTEGGTTVAVAEPGLVAVFGLGLIGLGMARRKNHRA